MFGPYTSITFYLLVKSLTIEQFNGEWMWDTCIFIVQNETIIAKAHLDNFSNKQFDGARCLVLDVRYGRCVLLCLYIYFDGIM